MAKGLDALLIAAGPPKFGKPKGDESSPDAEGGAKVRAAQRLISAISSKNARGVAKAFAELYEHCSHGGEESDEDESEEYDGDTEE